MKIILCGGDMPPYYVNKLGRYADRVEVMPGFGGISGATSTHPDMLGYAAGDVLYLSEEYYGRERRFFDSLGCRIEVCPVTFGGYPRDICFNVFAIDGVLYGRTDMTPPQITSAYKKLAKVKQGYAKCSAVLLGGGVVTADRGIAEAVVKNGGGALLITPGSVALRGYEYGFIGGACAVAESGTLIPFGDLDEHPDAARIRSFAAERGYTVDNGRPGDPLLDCGGVLTLNI